MLSQKEMKVKSDKIRESEKNGKISKKLPIFFNILCQPKYCIRSCYISQLVSILVSPHSWRYCCQIAK